MKLQILAENLQKKISLAQRAISSRAQLPILTNLLLEALEGKLRISATDLEIGIQVEIPAETQETGKVAIPAKSFGEFVNSLPVGKVILELTDNNLSVKTAHIKSLFQTTPADEFPQLFEEKGEELVQISDEGFKKDLALVVFASSIDIGSKPALSGVLLKKEKGEFLLVATDGYRLSLKHHVAPKKSGKDSEEKIIIPARILREFLSIKQGEKEMARIFISARNNQILFQGSDFILVGRLIEAEFPPYEKIIPADHATRVELEREDLLKAVKICAIFARDAANIVKLSFTKDACVVSAKAPSLGENSVDIETKLTGEENEIAFNARYLLDMLSNIDKNDMVFEMTGPLNPGVFKIKDDPTFLHIIMPIRVQG